MIDSPLVSIVTPSFNQGSYIEHTIRSVLEQDYEPIEFIIVDGGSTDESLEIIDRYSGHLAKVISEPDSGQTEAINKGFAIARGGIFAWLNSDDIYLPGAVGEAVRSLQSHPENGMVYGNARFIDEAGRTVGRFPAAQTDYRRLRRGYVHIPQQAAFFRSRLWRMVGPLDPTFFFAMDFDLWVRIAAITPMRHVPSEWAAFRLHGRAKTLVSADRCWPEMLRVHRRLGGGRASVIYAKYLIRRVLEPILPLRFRARLWWHQWAKETRA